MHDKELKEVLQSLSLKEKIYQLIQLSGDFFNAAALAVGPQQELGITQEVVDNAGSVLNVLGAEKIKRIQSEHLKKNRNKIPLLFMADIIYGCRTIYPIPLGLGCTWNPELIGKCCERIAEESCAAGAHVTYAPMADLVRDARWGRCLESTGEDAFLNSLYAKAMVEGFQGDFRKGKSIASCVKHFAGYGAVEAGRDYNTVDMSERRFKQDYLPAYKAAVDAGCQMVMTSFNIIDGIPATANKWLLRDILRGECGFEGIIITDYAAIKELIAHGVAVNEREAAKLAIEASVNIDMQTACYSKQLEPLVKDGEISEELIDEAVWKVLKLKNKLGLFEDPYRGASEELERQLFCSKRNRALAKDIASKSVVLLKNSKGILPIKSNDKKIALIGPYADSQDLIGLWAVHGRREEVVTLKTALEEKLDKEHLFYAKGCSTLSDYSFLGEFGNTDGAAKSFENIMEEAKAELDYALEIARKADIVILALGEHMMQSGEAGSRTNITLPDIQMKLLEKIKQCNKPIILILFNGRPLILTEVEQKVDAMLEGWFPGTEGGHALADVLFGEVNPTGRLTMSFPYAIGQIPVYYNEFSTGRPLPHADKTERFFSKFLDCPNDPLYPFGYGLSYTTYEYTNLRLDRDEFSEGENINVFIDVLNTGSMAGEETVQLYIRDLVGSVVRPVKELKDFCKVTLKPKETKTVSFTINEEKLKFFTKDMSYKAELGRFKVFVGKNSKDVMEADFTFTAKI